VTPPVAFVTKDLASLIVLLIVLLTLLVIPLVTFDIDVVIADVALLATDLIVVFFISPTEILLGNSFTKFSIFSGLSTAVLTAD
jgi:hypothetical protein